MTNPVYYNDNDAYCAQWLRNLIADGQLPAGDVDERSIEDVKSDDLVGYRQAHFFAGIGGWALAIRWAGYEDYDGLWTGSCPCQPLSGAGKRQGHADARHLWPAFYELIAQCRPSKCFGEQVGGNLGYEWLAGVRLDLEGCGYAVGTADLPAAGVGAPHIRQRLFWVAHASGTRQQLGERGIQSESTAALGDGSTLGNSRLADAQHNGSSVKLQLGQSEAKGRLLQSQGHSAFWSDTQPIGCADGKARRVGVRLCWMDHGLSSGMESMCSTEKEVEVNATIAKARPSKTLPHVQETPEKETLGIGNTGGHGTVSENCEGKPRRVPISPLSVDEAARTSKLRAYGNAIVPQLAAVFVQAAMEARP